MRRTRRALRRWAHAPAALVYAIHRSNGLLTPEKLFTFARSEMATTTMLAKLGIPLQDLRDSLMVDLVGGALAVRVAERLQIDRRPNADVRVVDQGR